MKKFALFVALAFELAVCGCANNAPNTTVSTTTTGNWGAQMTGGTGEAALLNFTTQFTLTANSGVNEPLDIVGFSFINAGECFGTAVADNREAGNATLTVSSTNTVSGSLNFTVTSATNGNVLTLVAPDGGLTGTTNGSPGTVGTLSNGIAVGTWTLTSSDTNCIPTSSVSGTFLMCQSTTQPCVPPAQ
jgi:hypothetical protein